MNISGQETNVVNTLLSKIGYSSDKDIPCRVILFINFKIVHADDIELSSNIRFIRECGVKDLVKSIKSLGFTFNIKMTVCEPPEGGTKYQLIDGAHRWAAVQRLSQSEDPALKALYTNFAFSVNVLPPIPRTQQMTLASGKY